MQKVCEVCNKKMGGFGNPSALRFEDRAAYESRGHYVSPHICSSCIGSYIKNQIEEKIEKEKNAPHLELMEQLNTIDVYRFNPVTCDSYINVGLVSAHVALGTGPLSQILSGVTDFFGQQSETYSNKMQEAEEACLTALKYNAYKKNASAIIGVQATYTELTKGSGQILVCMIGTAVKTK